MYLFICNLVRDVVYNLDHIVSNGKNIKDQLFRKYAGLNLNVPFNMRGCFGLNDFRVTQQSNYNVLSVIKTCSCKHI
jgi:hypothetical protein